MNPRNLSATLLVVVLSAVPGEAGGGPRVPKKHTMDEGMSGTERVPDRLSVSTQAGGLNWVLVDTMQNAFSMLSNRVDPLSYDPVSGTVGIVHRGKTSYALGSGELWYNLSPSGVDNWTRVAALNAGLPLTSRYPSAWIASGGGVGNELLAYSAQQANPGSSGWVLLGLEGLHHAAPFAVEDSGPFWSTPRVTAADDLPDIWWAASYDPNMPNSANSAVHLWKTTNYFDFTETDIWDLSLFQTRGLEIGLCYRTSVLYLGGYATLVGDPNEVMNVFYSKSTDGGATWSVPDGPNIGVGDWRTLPGLAGTPYTDWHVGDSFDMLVDAEGRVHIFGVVVDNVDLPTEIAIVEIFETGSGWDASIVSDEVATTTRTDYGGFDQMGFHANAATTPDGEGLGVFWLAAPQEGDSLPDIFLALKDYSSQEWEISLNITATPDFAELLLHVAPVFEYEVDAGLSAFVARTYESGTTNYPPDPLASTDIFVAKIVLFVNDLKANTSFPNGFQVLQNYPNPFNAQTEIGFEISDYGLVKLIVYDLLGREVATLVNGKKEAGTHDVIWDAAGLPSGVYFYRLQAGGFVETRKLVLLR